MRHLLLAVPLFFLLGCSAVTPEPERPFFHATDCNGSVYATYSAQCLGHEALLDRLEPYDVIFVGDHHTSKRQHRFVADLIRGLGKRGYRVHLGNEWFSPKDDPLLARYAAGELNDGNFTEAVGWEKGKRFDFELFAPIYHAVQENGGMLYGINLDRESRKKISDANISGMDEEERRFFEALDLNVSANRQLLDPFFSHCHKPRKGESAKECSERMYRVQVAWDTMMGEQIARLAEQVLNAPNEKLVIFIGAMHLENGLGANLRFARRSLHPFVTIIPKSWEQDTVRHDMADFVFLYEMEKETIEENEKLLKSLEEGKK